MSSLTVEIISNFFPGSSLEKWIHHPRVNQTQNFGFFFPFDISQDHLLKKFEGVPGNTAVPWTDRETPWTDQSEIFKILLVMAEPGSVRNFEFYACSGPVQWIGNTVPLILYYSMTGLDQYKHKILNLGSNRVGPGPTKIWKSRIGRSLVESADSRFLNFPVLVSSVLVSVRDQPALVLGFWFRYLYLF